MRMSFTTKVSADANIGSHIRLANKIANSGLIRGSMVCRLVVDAGSPPGGWSGVRLPAGRSALSETLSPAPG